MSASGAVAARPLRSDVDCLHNRHGPNGRVKRAFAVRGVEKNVGFQAMPFWREATAVSSKLASTQIGASSNMRGSRWGN